MPHKHKSSGAKQEHDLAPPSKHALPPAVGHMPARNKPAPLKRKKGKNDDDDTPKAFRRLLERQKQLIQGSKKRAHTDEAPSSSTDAKPNKKRKTVPSSEPRPRDSSTTPAPSRNATEIPRIQPYERLSDYGARVDASLPISGLQKRGNKSLKIGGKTLKQPQTKTEKRMQRMQAEWRTMAAKRKERDEAEADERELDQLEKYEYRVGDELDGGAGGKKRRKRREEDPWAVLDKRRKVQQNLGDVVQRPPDLSKLRGAKLKMRGQVPKVG